MIGDLGRHSLVALRLSLALALTCIIYALFITGVAQVVFHDQANGSLISRNGQVIGSRLIGQEFTDPGYFAGRPSATTSNDGSKPLPYNAGYSAGSNLAPSNKVLIDRVSAAVAQIRKDNHLPADSLVPVDLVTADFSGFDPDISPASALLQVSRVAAARGLNPDRLRQLVESHVDGPDAGIFGESHVNVLLLNMALDGGAAG